MLTLKNMPHQPACRTDWTIRPWNVTGIVHSRVAIAMMLANTVIARDTIRPGHAFSAVNKNRESSQPFLCHAQDGLESRPTLASNV